MLAKAGAVVTIDRYDGLVIYRGLSKSKLRTDKETKAAAKTGKAGHSDALVRELTAHNTFAIAAECIAKPAIALVALVYRLLLVRFYDSRDSCIDIDVGPVSRDGRIGRAKGLGIDPTMSPDLAKLDAERTAIKALLPPKRDQLFAWLLKADANKTLPRLLAYCVAECVDDIVADPKQRTSVDLARALGVDMRTRWTPKRDNYLSRVPSAVMLAALKECGADKAHLDQAATLKKTDLIDAAAAALVNWVPEAMRFGEPPAPAATKPKPSAKAKQ